MISVPFVGVMSASIKRGKLWSGEVEIEGYVGYGPNPLHYGFSREKVPEWMKKRDFKSCASTIGR
jgi:hypothetical protein